MVTPKIVKKIDTVIFDIGNVLADFDWEGYLRDSVHDPDMRGRVNEAMRGHGLWEELDRGVMPEADIIAGFIRYAPDLEGEIRRVCAHLGGCMRRREWAIPWIQSVKAAGRRVLYLSNYSRVIMQDNPGVLDFLPLMEGGIFSCNVHVNKPDPAIYRLLIERYRLNPASCVFIDDFEPNVAAARGLGLRAFRFESREQAQGDLAALF